MLDVVEARSLAFELHGEVELPGMRYFDPRLAFRVGTKMGSYPVREAGFDFLYHFGDIEHNIPPCKLKIWRLRFDTETEIAKKCLGEPNFTSHVARMSQLIELGERRCPAAFGRFSNVHFIRSPKNGKIQNPAWGAYGDVLYFGCNPSDMPAMWVQGTTFVTH